MGRIQCAFTCLAGLHRCFPYPFFSPLFPFIHNAISSKTTQKSHRFFHILAFTPSYSAKRWQFLFFSDNTFSKKLFRSLSGKRHFFPGYPCSIALQLSASDCDQAYAVLLSYPVSSFLIIHPAAIRSCKHGNLLPDRLRKIKNRMFGEHTGNQHNAHIRTSFSFAGR